MRSEFLRAGRIVVVAAILGIGVLAPRTVFATPNFPPAIQQDLSLAAAPDCGICHNDGDQGGKGTATTPFAENMRSRGLVEFDTTSLQTALNQMAAAHVDSAGDCLDDIDELKAGRNPNLPDPAGACEDAGVSTADGGAGAAVETPSAPTPRYGCIGSIAPRRSSDDAGWCGLILAALVLGRMRRNATKLLGPP